MPWYWEAVIFYAGGTALCLLWLCPMEKRKDARFLLAFLFLWSVLVALIPFVLIHGAFTKK